MFKGKAELENCQKFFDAKKLVTNSEDAATTPFAGALVSRLGIGTYLGPMDQLTDHRVTQAVIQAVELGCNFIDTAINYRAMRAESSVGEAIRRLVLSGERARNELFISTKAGFVPFERDPVSDVSALFENQYVSKGLAKRSDLVAGCHCMAPEFLANQISRSRKNLNLETIDLYYLHNPETQLQELSERVFYENLKRAFEAFESAVARHEIGAYGIASWGAFRQSVGTHGSVQLERVLECAVHAAHRVGNRHHGFRAIQLPFNLAMPEAAFLKTQKIGDQLYTAFDAAKELNIDVATSVPLFQSRLCHGLPEFIVERFPKTYSQAQCALSFSMAFSMASMVGMKQKEHVEHNLELLKKPLLTAHEIQSIVSAMVESAN